MYPRNNSRHNFGLSFALALFCVSNSSGEDWPQFRGARGTNYVPDARLPERWEPNQYAWRFDLGSFDVGCPVVGQGKVFLLSSDPQTAQRRIVALDLKTGNAIWTRSYDAAPNRLHARNTYGSSTPYADDRFVYVAWADSEHTWLRCLTHDGDEVWTRDFGPYVSQHGFATSPTIIGEYLVLLNESQADQLPDGASPGVSRMIAVRPDTGETVWETELTTTRVCYGVPALFVTPEGERQIVAANTGDGLFGLDYETGKMIWNQKVFTARCVSTPLVVGDLVLGTAGSGGGGNHLVAVRPEGNTAGEVYRIDRGAPYVPTPSVAKGKLFMVDDKGIASCVDAASGEVHWLQRVGRNYGASPIVLGDRVLLVSLTGQATILAAAEQFHKISSFDLGGPVGATPAYSDGHLLLRIGDELCALRLP